MVIGSVISNVCKSVIVKELEQVGGLGYLYLYTVQRTQMNRGTESSIYLIYEVFFPIFFMLKFIFIHDLGLGYALLYAKSWDFLMLVVDCIDTA